MLKSVNRLPVSVTSDHVAGHAGVVGPVLGSGFEEVAAMNIPAPSLALATVLLGIAAPTSTAAENLAANPSAGAAATCHHFVLNGRVVDVL